MDSTAFTLTPRQEGIVESARMFGEKWAPHATEIDRKDTAPVNEMIRDTVDLGLSGLTIPKKFGGRGYDAIEFALAVEQACRSMKSWMAGDILFATTCTGPSVIMMSDNSTAHARYLPKIASGQRTAAIALSEPKYGSAVTDIETSASLDGDVICINGSKRFITGAPDYDVYVTFVRLNNTPGMRGVGAVVVDKGTPGLSLGNGPEYMGSRGSPHGELFFDDCRVPRENLLMGEGSFAHLMQAFNMERLYISAMCLGLAQGAFDEAVTYSDEREQFGRPINEFQAVYHMIAEMWTQIESVRYLTYKAALTAERGKFPKALDVSTAKLHAADMGRDICWKAMQVLGGNGLVTGFPPERCFRDVIVSSIAGGTTQVLKNTIAAQVLGKRLNQRV
ncbi:Butyryl-CoA dehydrogenase [Mycobacterium sp. 852013-50091_SCH5140682]|uniref:acyl-CoA dehydrogenase family protein n=1 Tax=Mycobacterium sp. 852013-50091_SCH5140682 TaxID=1834109 RepID=UPI0007E9DFEA|nr:acyl-CoA dehydrogenase family protein [Mycobacterium sp. 852013-50091_SCH5140682]OBC12008.1 Butyryl-CoA dehydrogenase [Mycobacterium sp. 852013-50091_SCH5140682]